MMRSRQGSLDRLTEILRRGLAAALAGLLVCPSIPAFGNARHTRQSLTGKSLPSYERALQAVNRLTFGPRPGDVARIEAFGVDKWIEQQLHPETIDDSALEARLDSYPAMRLSQRDLLMNFPPEPIIKAVADGKMPLPNSPVERAIYSDRIYAYQQRQADKTAAAALPAGTPASLATGQQVLAHSEAPASSAMPGTAWARSFVAANDTVAATKASIPASNSFAADSASMEEPPSSSSIKANEQHLYADLAATSVVNLPPPQRIARIVSMPPAEFEGFQRSLTPQEKRNLAEDLTPQQREILLALKNPQQVVGGELLASRLLRDVYSDRQLEAVMTDFWLNHFNVYLRKGQFAPWYLADYERNAIRPHAFGKFEDLLVATAESPAMLFYLDNQQSVGPHSEAGLRSQMQNLNTPVNAQPLKPKGDLGLNENYARELMELHTLGVDSGYTQQDVTQVAEVFTGWGVNQPNQIAKTGNIGFEFNPRRHEPGTKQVLGKTIEPSGQNEGLEVLHRLAMSPATAHHVSEQLAIRFVNDKPSAELTNSMAATWMRTGGDIREVLRTMLASPDFWSKENYRAKVKTPEEFVVSAIRASDGDVIHPVPSLDALNQLGMPFFGCQTPNGYAWTSNAWVNTGDLLDRINFAISLANNKLGIATDLDSVISKNPDGLAPGPMPPSQKAEILAQALLSEPASPQTEAAILKQVSEMPTQVNVQPAAPYEGLRGGFMEGQKRWRAELPDSNAPVLPPSDPEAAAIAGLLLGSPDFQRK